MPNPFGGQGGMTPPNGMEIPEGMENMFPGQGGSGFPTRGQTGTVPTKNSSPWGILVITVLTLAAGLLFVWKFRR